MKTPKHTLSQLLFQFGFSANTLSAKAGMLLERLEEMYLARNATSEELDHLAGVMEKPRETIAPLFTVQAGNFNQSGHANRQKAVLKIQNLHVHIYPTPAAPAPEPKVVPRPRQPKALDQFVPRWEAAQLLPGSQAIPIQSLKSGTNDY